MKKVFSASKNLLSPKDQGADFVELFFDLVFVYAITRITSFSAHDLEASNLLRAVIIFWLIWWGWTQYTWSLNAANTGSAKVRMWVLIATGVAFVMATSVDQAFESGVMWFAVPYVVIRIIGLGLYVLVSINEEGGRPRILSFTIPSVIGLIVVLIGATADPSLRIWWWLGAIVIDMIAGYLGGRSEGLDINPKHFAERHGLIIIIALGESLIVAAHAVSSQKRIQELVFVSVLAVLVTCVLWWSYFSWVKEHLEERLSKKSGREQAGLARDAYSILHFPILCGIIGIAVGFEKIMGHPHDVLSIPVAVGLGGGYLLFVGVTAIAVWRLSNKILIPRIIILLISTIGIAFSVGRPPHLALSIIAASLILLIVIEWKKLSEQFNPNGKSEELNTPV